MTSMIGKLFLVVIVSLLLIPSMYAMEWDNVKSYDEVDKEITIVNALGLGADLAKIKLTTPQHNKVPIGYQKVAEFEVNSLSDYEDALGYVDLYNIRDDMRKIERDYDIKYRTYVTVQDPIYDSNYELLKNGSYSYVSYFKGYEEREVEDWIEMEKYDFKKDENLVIGLFTDVKKGDHVEFIPRDFWGVDIQEWADWTANQNVDLWYAWTMNETSGTNVYNSVNGTNNGTSSATWIAGKLDSSANITGGQDIVFTNNAPIIPPGTDPFSINVWVYPTMNDTLFTDSAHTISLWKQVTQQVTSIRRVGAGEYITFGFRADTQSSNWLIDFTDYKDKWTMLTFVYNGSVKTSNSKAFKLFVNGTDMGLGNMINIGGASTTNYIGTDSDGSSNAWQGKIDEYYIWNRVLNASEVEILWNDGNGVRYNKALLDASPVINLDSPANASTTANNYQRVNCSAIDDSAMLSLTLVVDGSNTNTIYNTTPADITLNMSYLITPLAFGMHNWTCFGIDNASQTGTNSTYFFNVTAKSPVMNLSSPVNNFNVSGSVILNCSATDDVAVLNTTLVIDEINNETFFNTTGSQLVLNVTKSITLPDGNHNWSCFAYDDIGLQGVIANRNFTVDSTAPLISLSSPNKTYHYGTTGFNLTLNWTVNDSGLGLSTCWFNNRTGNTTLTCGNNGTTFSPNYNVTSVIFYANDSLNNIGSDIISWDWLLWEFNQTFPSDVAEKTVNQFDITLDTLSGFTIISYFHYNNTRKLATLDNSGTHPRYSVNITSPTLGADVNITAFWNFTFINGSNTYVVLNSSNQTVRSFKVDDCTLNSVLLYNFSLKDEVLQTAINATKYNTTVEIDLDLFAVGETTAFAEFYNNFSENNNPQICLNATLGNSTYQVDLHITYDGDGYAPETFHLQKSTITNDSITQSINLFDLTDTVSQEFKITYKDSNFLAVRDALVQIQRKYVNEGLFKTVEQPLTDAQGETLGHFQLGNIIYNIIISKNGVVLGTFNNILPICQNPTITDCIINLNSFATSISPDSYTTGDDFAYTMSYNKDTRNVGTTYTIPSGTSGTVILNVTLIDGTGTTSSCTDTITSPSGTLNCTIPSTSGNGTAIARITRAGALEGYAMISLEQTPASIYGGSLVLIGLIMIVSIIGIGVSNNPMITAIFGLVGGGMLIAMNLLDTGVGSYIGAGATILWLFIAIVIILIKGSKRI